MVVKTRGLGKISFLKGPFIVIGILLIFELADILILILLKDFLAGKTVFEQIFLGKVVSFLIEIYAAKIFLVIF